MRTGDALVIGAGMGGLSAAIVLAARGLSVDVLEAAESAGGKLGVVVIDGVEVDTGPSVLTLPEVLDQVLRLAGTSLQDELSLREPAPAFRYLYPDGAAVDVYPALEDTLRSVRDSLGSDAARELESFLDYSRRIWEAAGPHFVFGPAPSPRSLLRAGPGVLASLVRIDPFGRMWKGIEQRVRSTHLRMLLARYATYNGSDVRRAPATLNCIAHVELAIGGYGVEGGMYEITRALLRAAERVGVRIHTGTRVERIQAQDGRIRGAVSTDGHLWKASTVVGNADSAHVLGDLLPDQARAQKPDLSMSGWTGIIRARRRTGEATRVAHTVLFPSDYLQEFADIFHHDRPPTEPTVYLCAEEPCHGREGWPEDEPVFVMANAPAEPASGERAPAVWDQLRQAVLRRMDSAGLRDPGDALVWERTPTGLANAFPGSRGSIYGAASNSPLAAFRRPSNRVGGIRGLYLASGSAHPGGGVPLCLLSGQAAAAAALADLG